MKRTFILTTIAVMSAAIFLTSCGPSRVYGHSHPAPPPPSRTHFSLIISPTPGFVISRYPDGRYYHRSPQGYLYWRGNDNRFYLDRSHIGRVRYSQWEYNQWRKYNRSNGRGRYGRR